MSVQNLQFALHELSENVLALSYFSDEMPQKSVIELREAAELIRVLSRVIDGKTIYRAFGAPGDWGYERPLGNALSLLYRDNAWIAGFALTAPTMDAPTERARSSPLNQP
jgi:hypothetical protein